MPKRWHMTREQRRCSIARFSFGCCPTPLQGFLFFRELESYVLWTIPIRWYAGVEGKMGEEGLTVAVLKKPGKHMRGAIHDASSETDKRDKAYNDAHYADESGHAEGDPVIYGLNPTIDNNEFLRHRERGNRYMIIFYVIVILTISHFVVGFPSLYHFLYLWRMLSGLLAGLFVG